MEVAVENETLRQQTLEAAKQHKASWLRLGQYLFSVHKDKLFKTWGFLSFETYCRKELGIKETTASKLLKSYFYMEKEEPTLVKTHFEEEKPATIPHYESVNLLRLAKDNKKIPPQDFADIRKSVMSAAKEPQEVRAQVKRILEAQEPKDPNEVRRSRRNAAIRRMITSLTGAKRELEAEKLLPAYLLTQISELLEKLQDQIEE